ncbi:DUF4214 domain-containing protein, partial [Betaproteobacteria bacterium]|nr:DUF4214 domain-containing protein [Betaproteobacteria bacterium]
ISYHTYSTPVNNSGPNVDYEVSVFHTEQGHKYQFNSSGEAAETIELISGKAYTFSLASSTLSHPFKLSETSDGIHAGGFSYDNGITYTQGTDVFNFVPENSASDLYYYCSFHSGMGGKIRILDYDNTGANESFMAGESKYTFEAFGSYELYNLRNEGSAWYLTSSSYGTDTLQGFKRIEFTNGTLALDIDAGDTAGQAYRLYQAAFARTPDMPGVAYHINDMESNGLSIQQIASNFMASPEFKTQYGENLSDDAYINALYQNVLGRGASDDEVAYYQDHFDREIWDRPQVMINFAESPENLALVGPDITSGIWMPF